METLFVYLHRKKDTKNNTTKMRVQMKTPIRKRKSATLTPEEKLSIQGIIDKLETKADALDLLGVKTYNTIDKVYYSGKASPDLIKKVRSVIKKHTAAKNAA